MSSRDALSGGQSSQDAVGAGSLATCAPCKHKATGCQEPGEVMGVFMTFTVGVVPPGFAYAPNPLIVYV